MAPSATVALLALALCFWPQAHFYAIDVSTAGPSEAVAPPPATESAPEKGIRTWFSGSSGSNVNSLPAGSQGSNISSPLGLQGNDISSQSVLRGNDVSVVNVQSALSGSSVSNSPCEAESEDCGKGSSPRDQVVVEQYLSLNDSDSFANATDTSSVEGDGRSDWSERQAAITREGPHRLNSTNFVTSDPILNTSSVNLAHLHINSTASLTTVIISTLDTRKTSSPTTQVASKTTGKAPPGKPRGGSPGKKPKGHETAGKKKVSTTKTSVSSQPTHHLARHFTGFVQHVWLPNSTPRPPGMSVCLLLYRSPPPSSTSPSPLPLSFSPLFLLPLLFLYFSGSLFVVVFLSYFLFSIIVSFFSTTQAAVV